MRRLGSGYRVTADVVLTAAHVVEDALGVHARFTADPARKVPAKVLWTEGDLAALRLLSKDDVLQKDDAPRKGDVLRKDDALRKDDVLPKGDVLQKSDVLRKGDLPPKGDLLSEDGLSSESDLPPEEGPAVQEGGLRPVRYGLVDNRAGELRCQAVGFPRFKMRGNLRDSAHMTGFIRPLSHRYTGTLDVRVEGPPAENERRSPWEGMSGAALFAGGRLVGIVSEHYPDEGTGNLTAQRADWTLTPEQREQIGYVEVTAVNPPAGRRPGGHLGRVRDLAPAEGLRDRDEELRRLTAFCLGEEPYLWLRGSAWSGKTALASSFALDPPPGVRVAAFFVSGHTDADAFVQAMGEQLAAVAEVPGGAAQLDDLLEDAAQRCRENGERLLLVVDGLDEDRGRSDRSVASLLPRDPPEGVRVLVTGRPHPGIPDDVRAGHPLRTCRTQELAPNAYATHLENEAGRDFRRSILVPRNKRLLGVLAVAGGALTLDDLAALTKLPRYEVRERLGGRVFTRTEDGYLYAHETLLRMGERDLAPKLDGYRARIHRWADSYRERGWPRDTPAYLLGSYGRLLVESAHPAGRARLVDYALDHARHEQMRGLVDGESAAVRELAAAQRAVGDDPDPDLLTLTRLAVTRDQIGGTASPPPVELPALWARLGRPGRAVALARSIVDADARASALAAVAKALAEGGEPGAAESLARSIDRAEKRAMTLGAVAKALADRGEFRAAETVARSIGETFVGGTSVRGTSVTETSVTETSIRETSIRETSIREISVEETEWRVRALAATAEASRSTELLDEAERSAPSVVDLDGQARTTGALVRAAAVCGETARAEALVDRLPHMNQRVWALSVILKALADGDRDRDQAVVNRYRDQAVVNRYRDQAVMDRDRIQAVVNRDQDQTVTDRDQDQTITDRDRIQAVMDRAVEEAGKISQEHEQSWAMSALVTAVARCGDVTRATALARGLRTPYARSYALAALAGTVGAGGDPEGAEALAGDGRLLPAQRVRVLCDLAKELAGRGDTEWAVELAEQAEALTRTLTPRGRRARGGVAVAEAFGACADPRAETVALSLESPYYRVQALVAAAGAAPDPDRACALAERAETLARTQTPFTRRARVLVSITDAVAAGGDLEHAEALARTIPDPAVRTRVLIDLVKLIAARDVAWAESVVRERIPGAEDRDRARVWVAKALAARGELDRAEELALSLPDTDLRAQALALLVKEIPGMDRAVAMARRIPHADRRGQVFVGLAQTMAGRGALRRARALARTLPAADQRAHALLAVAMSSAGGGDPELLKEVEKLVRRVPDEDRRTRLVTALVKALADAGRLRHAERLARDVAFPEARAGALADVAAAFASRGQLRRALAMVGNILAPASRARAYVAVVKALSDRGDVAAAFEIAANEIPTADHMAQAFTVLVRESPGGGSAVAEVTRRAESLFPARVTHPDQQLMAFVHLLRAVVDSAGTAAGRGLADRIEDLAAGIESADRRAQVLVALSRTVEPVRGRRLLARVLGGPAWTAALGALHEVEPQVLPTIAEECLGDGPRHAARLAGAP